MALWKRTHHVRSTSWLSIGWTLESQSRGLKKALRGRQTNRAVVMLRLRSLMMEEWWETLMTQGQHRKCTLIKPFDEASVVQSMKLRSFKDHTPPMAVSRVMFLLRSHKCHTLRQPCIIVQGQDLRTRGLHIVHAVQI